jgi:hypothetical protein
MFRDKEKYKEQQQEKRFPAALRKGAKLSKYCR